MRTLTIKRNKAFAGWATKSKVYVEDYMNNDIIINGVPCRKIGTLKNGEEKSFEIEPVATRVYIIGDKLSRNMCNDFCKIPAGEEDVVLTGEHKYNPFNGNAFRFDGVTDEEVLANRKKTNKKAALFFAFLVVVGFCIGFALTFFGDIDDIYPEAFTYGNMSITLTNEFSERNVDGFSACYESYSSIILINKDDKEFFEDFDSYTLEEYGNDIIENSEYDVELQKENGLTYFEYVYNDEESGDVYSYFVPVYKSDDAFWLFQFSSFEEDYETYREQFVEWAKTVEFAQE
ncbi:MAG: hypothetical protein IJW86_00265 [Clostridia bacterium]|nr:hypothetical protein [Clostridia bacterium]